jgi:hypothetical protein
VSVVLAKEASNLLQDTPSEGIFVLVACLLGYASYEVCECPVELCRQ